jgi:hypothetical protein
MGRFDRLCGGMVFLVILGGFALAGRRDGLSGEILAGGLLGIMAVWLLVRVMLIFFHLGRCVTRDVVHLATGGTVRTLPQHGVVRPHRLQSSQDFIERLCWESGWLLVARENDMYTVRSGDHTVQQMVYVRWSPQFASALFYSFFPVRFSLEREAPGLYARLMMRNQDLHWSAWSTDLGGSCEACPMVKALIPAGSLNARLFAQVCQEIAGEINAFHAELRGKLRYSLGQVGGDTPYRVPQEFPGDTPMRQAENLPVRRQQGLEPGVWYTN